MLQDLPSDLELTMAEKIARISGLAYYLVSHYTYSNADMLKIHLSSNHTT